MAVSLKINNKGLQIVDEARKKLGWKKASTEWCEQAGVSLASLKRFWLARPIQRESFINICEAVGVDWQQAADLSALEEAKSKAVKESQEVREEIPVPVTGEWDWRSLAEEKLVLEKRKRLTTNPLTNADGKTFEIDDLYVPVEVVERSHLPKLRCDVSPEERAKLSQSRGEAFSCVFETDEFFAKVLCQGNSKSQGRRSALIGRVGSGKTTLLQKMAFWVLEKTDDIPIWISLADLQGKSLESYLLEDWLKDAMGRVRVTEEMQESLAELFNSKRVWLLLDGLDEMVTEKGSQLGAIASQLKGWIAKARIILTSRLNVWDIGKNPLEEFDTYLPLGFTDGDGERGDRVGKFINSWFGKQPDLGYSLRSELNDPDYLWLRDTVKNPLWLALLCCTWGRWEGKLPNKEVIYEQFSGALYQWKQAIFPITSHEITILNEAMRKLAVRALEENNQSCLRHRNVCDLLGEPNEPLYRLALKIGWLNIVGIAAENPDEPVYVFWSPGFQWYFARKVENIFIQPVNNPSENQSHQLIYC